MKTVFQIIIAFLLVSCTHHAPTSPNSSIIDELNQTYPIIGISISEFEILFSAIKEQIPTDEQIISINVAKKSTIVKVVTGRIDAPLEGLGSEYVFEKQNGKWKLIETSEWIS